MNLKELTAYALNTFHPKVKVTPEDIRSVEKNDCSSFSVIIMLHNGRMINVNGTIACRIIDKINEGS